MSKIFLSLILFVFLFLPKSVSAFSASVRVPEEYDNVRAGERLYFEIDIKYPENSTRKDLRLEYLVYKDGKVVAQSKSLKAIETQISFIDYIVIPEDSSAGNYSIVVNISDYENLREQISVSFNVLKGNDFRVYFFLMAAVIVILFFIIFLEIRKVNHYLKL